MPSYQEWVRKIDINIDYYSAFIKSWIAFNSWYRSEYTERTDRGIIEKLKTENNRFKGYIETMLDENNKSDEAIIFKKNLKDLQSALFNAAIVTQERDGINQQISFSEKDTFSWESIYSKDCGKTWKYATKVEAKREM